MVGDDALFYFHKEDKLYGLITLHVDDFLLGGTEQFHKEVTDVIEKDFKCSKREVREFRFAGVDIKQLENGDIEANQKTFVDAVEELDIADPKEKQRSLEKDEYKKFRGVIGKLG